MRASSILTWFFSGVLDPSVRHHSCHGRRPTCGDESWSTSRRVPSSEKPVPQADLEAGKKWAFLLSLHLLREHAVILLCRSDVNETNTVHKNTLILLQLAPVSMVNVISSRRLAELTIEVNRYTLEEILHQVRLLLYRQILKQKTWAGEVCVFWKILCSGKRLEARRAITL